MRGSGTAMRLCPVNCRAFTLVELIVVMALIGLTASFAVPRIASFLYADQLKVTVRKLVGLIHRSSQLAQQQQAPYLLTYKRQEHAFIVGPETVAARKKEEIEKKENRLQLADSVTVRDLWSWYGGPRSSEEVVIRFNKNGYIEPTIMHLRKDDGQEISVVLSPFLGKVRIVDGYVLPDKEALFQ